MYKRTFLFLLTPALSLSLTCSAQSDYIVKKNGDTLYGNVVLSMKKVRFGNQKFKAKDNELLGCYLAAKNQYFELMKSPFLWLEYKERIFLERLTHGTVKVYYAGRYKGKRPDQNLFNKHDITYLIAAKKGDGQLNLLRGGGSKGNFATEKTYKTIRWWFKDNPDSLEEVDTMPPAKEDFVGIIERYNAYFEGTAKTN